MVEPPSTAMLMLALAGPPPGAGNVSATIPAPTPMMELPFTVILALPIVRTPANANTPAWTLAPVSVTELSPPPGVLAMTAPKAAASVVTVPVKAMVAEPAAADATRPLTVPFQTTDALPVPVFVASTPPAPVTLPVPVTVAFPLPFVVARMPAPPKASPITEPLKLTVALPALAELVIWAWMPLRAPKPAALTIPDPVIAIFPVPELCATMVPALDPASVLITMSEAFAALPMLAEISPIKPLLVIEMPVLPAPGPRFPVATPSPPIWALALLTALMTPVPPRLRISTEVASALLVKLMAPKSFSRPTPLGMPKVVSLLKKVRLPGAVTVATAPKVELLKGMPPPVMFAPGLTVTTVVPAKLVFSVPPVAGLAASQVTLPVFSPAQAASALCGQAAMTAMKAPVKAVLVSSVDRLR
jgi:hypothetical protein